MPSQYVEDLILRYLIAADTPRDIGEICQNLHVNSRSMVANQLNWMVKVKHVEISTAGEQLRNRKYQYFRVTDRGRAIFAAGGYH